MTKNSSDKTGKDGERIAKVMARAGLCSRRDAEGWIAAGRVKVNGRVLQSPALNVTEADRVEVDGKPLQTAEATRLFLYHKPPGLVTTHKDEKGRATVFENLPPDLPRVVSVGRLDYNTEGLLLLTNDGGLARYLELPRHAWIRRYRVRVHGNFTPEMAERLGRGMSVDGIRYAPAQAVAEGQSGRNSWLSLSLKEGKNREVRKLMGALGLDVTRLIRVAYGPFLLGELPRGAAKEVKTRVLKDQIAGYFKQSGPAK